MNLKTTRKMKTIEEIITEIIESTKRVDFKSLANIKDTDKNLKVSSLIVLIIEAIIKSIKTLNYDMCYHKNSNHSYLFNGEYWVSFDEDYIKNLFKSCSIKLGYSPEQSKFYEFKDKLFKQFQSSYIRIDNNENIESKINLKNGTLKFFQRGIKLSPFNKNDFNTYQLPYIYNPDSKTPSLFYKYLDDVLPDKNSQLVLAEYIGSIFLAKRDYKDEQAMFLLGSGANGKSVFFDIINALLGTQNVTHYSINELTDTNGYNRAGIANKLLNYASESGTIKDVDMLKKLISREPVTARLPYGKPMTLINYGKLMFNCNVMPKSTEKTHAIYRRMIIINFNITIPKAKQDKMLSDKIIDTEMEGVLNWVIDGLKRLLKNETYTESKLIDEQVELYKNSDDTFHQYLKEEGWKPHKSNYQQFSYLFENYKNFCADNRMKTLPKNQFKERMIQNKFTFKRHSVDGNIFNASKN